MYFGVMLSDSQARMMFVVLLNLLPVQRLFAGLGMLSPGVVVRKLQKRPLNTRGRHGSA